MPYPNKVISKSAQSLARYEIKMAGWREKMIVRLAEIEKELSIG